MNEISPSYSWTRQDLVAAGRAASHSTALIFTDPDCRPCPQARPAPPPPRWLILSYNWIVRLHSSSGWLKKPSVRGKSLYKPSELGGGGLGCGAGAAGASHSGKVTHAGPRGKLKTQVPGSGVLLLAPFYGFCALRRGGR